MGFPPRMRGFLGVYSRRNWKFARKVGLTDLIVVCYRRQSAFDLWWSGSKGAYLMDYTDCSLLVARNAVNDETIAAPRS